MPGRVLTGASAWRGGAISAFNEQLRHAAFEGRHANMVAALEGGAEIDYNDVSRRAERGG